MTVPRCHGASKIAHGGCPPVRDPVIKRAFNQKPVPVIFVIYYQHIAYQNSLKKHGIIQSMSRKGNCLDNAMMENFFGLMKSELLYPGKYTSADTFIKDLIDYIEYYNNERIKLRLNGMSPVQYRKMLTASIV